MHAHRPWSTVLLVISVIGVALTGIVLLGGLILAGKSDPGTEDQAIGLALATLGLVAAAVYVVLLVLVGIGRRRADDGRPVLLRVAAGVAIAFGGANLVAGLVAEASGSPLAPGPSGYVAPVLMLAVGIPLLRATFRPPASGGLTARVAASSR